MNRTWPLLYCLEEAPVINPHLPRMAACLVGHCPPPHPPPLCEKLAFSSSDLFLLVRISPHPSFSNSKCWVKVWSVYPICEKVAIIVPACQSGWEEVEHLGGNLWKFEEIIQNEITLGGSPTITVTLICEKFFVHYIEYFYKTKGK